MPTFNQSDVKFYLSGGVTNSATARSLGGHASHVQVKSGVNNLFARVPSEESSKGGEKYRCIYIVNEGACTMENVSIFIQQNERLSDLSVGFIRAAEVQEVDIGGTVTGGTFTLVYRRNVVGTTVEQETDPITFDPDLDTTAANIAAALNALDYLSGVEVTGDLVNGINVFQVTFDGDDAYRDHSLLAIGDNSLTGTAITASTRTLTPGSPVNAIVDDIGFENQPPIGVDFHRAPAAESALPVGRLEPYDGFAVWLRRTTPAKLKVFADDKDDAVLQIKAQVLAEE